MPRCGLIGTITSDSIVQEDGPPHETLGGVLYQAAAFSGLGQKTALFSHCGEALRPAVETLIADWPGLDRKGLVFVPGPGNRVRLRYSKKAREREEVLESVVPALDPGPLLEALPSLDILLMVFNSGLDVAFCDWRLIVERSSCLVWFDVHSLALEPRVGVHRDYRAVPDWPEWVKGVACLQANRQEVGCLMGHPERWATDAEIREFIDQALGLGVRAVFVTKGKDGVLVAVRNETRPIPAPAASAVVDATGCGDVFAAAAVEALLRGRSVFQAAEAGVALATAAVAVSGLCETFLLASRDTIQK
ncbi:MAG: carbohydrate kinase family protein [Candidatus Aminicenantes bacterium]|nr:carbohydrate kinase family protein [Candidatus Aminicenantes bacterium]